MPGVEIEKKKNVINKERKSSTRGSASKTNNQFPLMASENWKAISFISVLHGKQKIATHNNNNNIKVGCAVKLVKIDEPHIISMRFFFCWIAVWI